MKTANHSEAWAILASRKAERKENRVAFIAALLMERSREPGRRASDETGELRPHIAEAFAVEFARLAESIKRLCEADCNYGLSPAQEKRQQRLEARFAALAGALGFEARTGGDPRGACAYLIDPDERRGDGWGEGWAVYR